MSAHRRGSTYGGPWVPTMIERFVRESGEWPPGPGVETTGLRAEEERKTKKEERRETKDEASGKATREDRDVTASTSAFVRSGVSKMAGALCLRGGVSMHLP